MNRLSLVATVFGALLGIAVGICGFTFTYAKGGSYLTNNPAACANCHVMREQYDDWSKSSHRAVATCNDCHTPGYAEAAGKVPEKDWLVGDRLGWRGPWGTTYASNLRMLINGMSEAQWLDYARTLKSRPPMPSFTLNEMRKADLRAIYHFIRSLGPAGVPAPAYVPPEQEPAAPFVQYPAPPK